MKDEITSSPLTWPEGWKRASTKKRSQFKSPSIAVAINLVTAELGRMGIKSFMIIISTNLRLKKYSPEPYSVQKEPVDNGVAVWFREYKDGSTQQVIALDKYDRVADNIYAIGKTIEAMRGIKRWGGGEILDRAFTGFIALPKPDGSDWRKVLDYYGNDLQEANSAYKSKRNKAHPDKGGNKDDFYKINVAWIAAEKELSK